MPLSCIPVHLQMERTHITVIQCPRSTPIIGIMTMGNTSATRIPLIMMVEIRVNTESLPRCMVFSALKPDQRTVTLDLQLLLPIKNPYTHKIEIIDGVPQSKEAGHELGTHSIKYVTEK